MGTINVNVLIGLQQIIVLSVVQTYFRSARLSKTSEETSGGVRHKDDWLLAFTKEILQETLDIKEDDDDDDDERPPGGCADPTKILLAEEEGISQTSPVSFSWTRQVFLKWKIDVSRALSRVQVWTNRQAGEKNPSSRPLYQHPLYKCYLKCWKGARASSLWWRKL